MGAYVTANGVPAVTADITRPRLGAWHADLRIDAAKADRFEGPIEIIVADSLHLQGTAHRVGVHHESVFVRVVGGAGGLGTMLEPRAWRNVPLSLALSDVLDAAGETLSPTSDAGALQTLLPYWTRPAQLAGAEIGALFQVSGAQSWRVLSDGTIWIGSEGWPRASLAFQEVEFEPELGRLTFGADVPSLNPGDTFVASGESYDGSHVSTVRHLVTANLIRHFAWFEDEAVSTPTCARSSSHRSTGWPATGDRSSPRTPTSRSR
jgi:hypothetical protein